jgi:hypothetical protein
MPAKISFLRPVASIALATRASSNALTDERSMISTPGRASASSGIVGHHMLSRAVVATTVGNFNAFAALARATTCFVNFMCSFPASCVRPAHLTNSQTLARAESFRLSFVEDQKVSDARQNPAVVPP